MFNFHCILNDEVCGCHIKVQFEERVLCLFSGIRCVKGFKQ